jgi:hypothetical protein
MSNDFINYINHLNVIEEAISPENYRDNQIGKKDSNGEIIFVNNFLDKVISFMEAIPEMEEYDRVGPKGDDPYSQNDRIINNYASRSNYKDVFKKIKNKTSEIITSSDHDDNYIKYNKIEYYKKIKSSLYEIKNKNCDKSDVTLFLPKAGEYFKNKINSNTLTSYEERELYEGIYNFILSDKLTSRLVEVRGKNNNIWLVSPIKDAIYNTTLKDQLSKNSKVKKNLLKQIQNEITDKEKNLDA